MDIKKITLSLLLLFGIYLIAQQNKIKEKMANTDVSKLDVSIIKSLCDMSKILLDGIVVPGDVNITGESNLVPKGCVIIWSGPANKIPKSWALCDGNNGTPDLKNRFIYGGESTLDITKPDTLKGGTSNKTLTVANLPPHTHRGRTNDGGAYTYLITVARDNNKGDSSAYLAFRRYFKGLEPLKVSHSGHSHTLTTDGGDGCIGAPFEIIPPYYKMCYIIKL